MRQTSALLALLLVACGNTTVKLELTDAPPDTASIDHVFISLSRVEVHVAGDDDDDDEAKDSEAEDDDDEGGGWHSIDVPDHAFDLVALQNDVRATLGELELPDGKI